MLGYVASQYLLQPVDRGSEWYATVQLQDPINGYLNVRSEPSTSANIIGKLYHGQSVLVYFDRSIPIDWSKINF